MRSYRHVMDSRVLSVACWCEVVYWAGAVKQLQEIISTADAQEP